MTIQNTFIQMGIRASAFFLLVVVWGCNSNEQRSDKQIINSKAAHDTVAHDTVAHDTVVAFKVDVVEGKEVNDFGCDQVRHFLEEYKLFSKGMILDECYALDSINIRKNLMICTAIYSSLSCSDPVCVDLVILKNGDRINHRRFDVINKEDFSNAGSVATRFYLFKRYSSPAGYSKIIIFDSDKNRFYDSDQYEEFEIFNRESFDFDNKFFLVEQNDSLSRRVNFN